MTTPDQDATHRKDPPAQATGMSYPIKKPTAKLAKRGPLALMSLLIDADAEAFEVPLAEDYGIDVLAQLPHSYYTGQAPEPEGDTLPSAWQQEWGNRILASASGKGPDGSWVLGRFVGFQVKTSTSFSPDDEVWKLQLEVRHLNYWRNCDFPVIIIASTPQGTLRYRRAQDLPPLSNRQHRQSTVQVELTEALDSTAVTRLLGTERHQAAKHEALIRASDLCHPDPEERAIAMIASWAAVPDPRVTRLVTTLLPSLHPDIRTQAAILVASLIEYCRTQAARAETDTEHREAFDGYLAEVGADQAPHYSDDEWLTLSQMWTAFQLGHIRANYLRTPNDEMHLVPDDPWPDVPLEDEVTRVARTVVNRLQLVAPWDSFTVLLSRATDPLDLATRLAITDLTRNPTDPEVGERWIRVTDKIIHLANKPRPTHGIRNAYMAAQQAGHWRTQQAETLARVARRVLAEAPAGTPATQRFNDIWSLYLDPGTEPRPTDTDSPE